ncbi:hypothetical protein DICA3_F22342 [Diutina catenulata]
MRSLESFTKYLAGPFHLRGDPQKVKEAISVVQMRGLPLVAIDVEAWERASEKVTELGISVYDPRKSTGRFPHIRTTHLIIKENHKYFNSRYVPDKKHQYNGMVSYVMAQAECAKFIQKLLTGLGSEFAFVGHQFDGDISWLRSIGIHIPEVPVVDVGKIFQQSRSAGGTLHGVLDFCDVPHANLHNAANDAYYTLVAALAITDPDFRQLKKMDTFVECKGATKSQKRRDAFRTRTPSVVIHNADELWQMYVGSVVTNGH